MSFEEATVQSATKPKSLLYETQICNTNDEANTMTERDVGSTFLLPHTHLYKPEKDSSKHDIVIMSCKMISEFTQPNIKVVDKDDSKHPRDSRLNTIVLNQKNTDDDSDDDETELTNLNWLLRNQTIAWPNAINNELEDEANMALSRTDDDDTSIKGVGIKNNCCTNPRVGSKPLKIAGQTSSQIVQRIQPSKPTPTERFEIFVHKLKRDLKEYEKSACNYKNDVTCKPPFNYSHIIGMAMLEKGRITLQQICTWIETRFAFFRVRKKWNNSIRHNLSLHHCFRKIDRKREEKGKGGYWELGIDPKKCERKRIRNRKSSQLKTKHTVMVHNPTESCLVSPQQENSLTTMFANNKNYTIPSSSNNHDKLQSISQFIFDDIKTDSTLFQQLQNEERYDLQDIESTDFGVMKSTHTGGHIGLNGLSLTNLLSCPTLLNDSKCDDLYTYKRDNVQLQQQYELGTIIISTATTFSDETSPRSFNCLINENFSNSNVIYTEDELPPASEDVIISSYLTPIVEGHHANNIDHIKADGPNVIVEHLPQLEECISGQTAIFSTANSSSITTVNCDYATNCRPFGDGIDEAFHYLHNIEINRSEDILDSLLDVCVSEY